MVNKELIKNIFGWAGTVIAQFFYISPIVPIIDLVKGVLTYKNYPGLMSICSFGNCILWVIYGYLRREPQMLYANLIGGCFSIIWISFYLCYLSELKFFLATFYNCLFFLGICLLWLVFYYIIGIKYDKNLWIGYSAMIINILMYAAPAQNIITAIKTKNSKLLPIVSIILAIISAICWFIYGILINDISVYIPNLLGLIFGVIQFCAWIYITTSSKGNLNKETKEVANEE